MDGRFEPIFPGMDPFIENQRWQDFHQLMISGLAHELGRLIAPRYNVQTERHIDIRLRADVAVSRGMADAEPRSPWLTQPDVGSRTLTATVQEVDEEQPRIEIRDEHGNLVTVIEMLSPANKERHRSAYLANRNALVQSETNLVELDLLRSGRRMEADLPTEGYVILVCRAQGAGCHRCDAYEVGLRDRLPVIPIPLLPEDGDVGIALQPIFNRIYVDLAYRFNLDYTMPLTPPIANPDDAAWVEDRLRAAGVLP